MIRKTYLIFVGLLTIAALVVFATVLSRATLAPVSELELPAPPEASQKIEARSSALPVRLVIPALKIDTNVQKVGISKRGTMAVPTNYTDVGWYKYGAIPGRLGSAVMAGHLDNGFGLPGVFKNLINLKPGDEVIVRNADGTRLYFKVDRVGTLTASTKDTQFVFANSEAAHLNLITCEGTWNAKDRSYSLRRIVYTTLSKVESG